MLDSPIFLGSAPASAASPLTDGRHNIQGAALSQRGGATSSGWMGEGPPATPYMSSASPLVAPLLAIAVARHDRWRQAFKRASPGRMRDCICRREAESGNERSAASRRAVAIGFVQCATTPMRRESSCTLRTRACRIFT
jgi:hypothetical protein